MTEIIRVLYIDDEPALLEIGKVFLERDGKIKVDTLISPSEALKRLKYERYNAIISDYEMPEKNGVELLKLLKIAGDTTPFIIFTGRGREEVVIEAFNNGADFYIQKGGDPKAQFIELSNKIHYAISRRRAEEALLASVEGMREASSRYAVLIAASNTGAWEYHNNSGFLWCSSEYFSMLGRDISDFDFSGTRNIDQTWIDLLHPDDRARAIQNFDTYLICPEGMYEQYFRMLHRDGHWVWILSRGKTLTDTDGKPTTITVGTHIDVTDRKLAEESLRIQHDLVMVLNRCTDLKEAFDQILLIALQIEGLDAGGIYIRDPVSGALEIKSHRGLSPQFIKNSSYYAADAPQIINAKTGEARYGSYTDIRPVTDETRDQERLRAIASIPVMHEGELIALLNMASHSADEIPGAARQILETLAMQIGTTISRIRSRKALQESEEKYRMLVENSADLIWTLNAEGMLGYISPSWERVLGYEPASVVGKKFHLFVHPDDIGAANDYLARIIKTHTQMASMEYRVKHADGTWRWHTGSGSGIYDNKGTFLSFVGVSRDITGQKQAEEALRESETRYRHIFESFEDLYYQTDNDGLITILSPSLQRLSGWKPEDLIGTQSSVIYVKPGEREDLLNAIAKCGYVRDYELLLLNKDGSHIPVSVTASRIYSPEGTLAGIAGSLRDITDRKRMDAALIESEAKYRLLTDRMNDIIWILDLNLRTTYTSPSIKTVLGFTPQERMVQQVTEQVTPESLSIMQGVLARELAFEHQGSADPSRSVSLEMEYYHKNGSTVWLESVISGIRDDHGVLLGFHGVSRDITERKRADVALAREGEERRILLDNIHTQVWYLTDNHTYGAVNRSHADFIGVSIEDLAFKDMNDLLPEDAINIFRQSTTGTFKTTRPVHTDVWVPHASGDLRLLSILTSPKLDTEGKVEYVVCSAEDITDRTLAEHERTQAYTILENSPILAWVVNIKEKRTEYCNSGLEKFFGKTLSEMNADPQFWKEHIHPDDKEKLIESSIARLFPEGKVSGEYRVGPYNSDQWLMTTLQLVKDEKGSPTHMIGVSLDITERKRIEGALQIANKKLQLLTSITRHDILNQMMALQGYILGSQSNSTTI